MKKLSIIFLIFLFIVCIGVSASSATLVNLYDWAFYVDGARYESVLGDPMPTTGTLDASGFGTLTWTTNVMGPHTFMAFFDYEIDEAINTFFNEYGAANGTPAAGQSWEIDEPGYVFGDIYEHVTGWNGTDYTGTIGLDNYNNVPAGWEDDVSMAMGWNFTLTPLDLSATITLDLYDTIPASGFYLSHTDPDSGDYTIYYSSNINITPIPEPATFLLLFSGILGLLGIGRKRMF